MEWFFSFKKICYYLKELFETIVCKFWLPCLYAISIIFTQSIQGILFLLNLTLRYIHYLLIDFDWMQLNINEREPSGVASGNAGVETAHHNFGPKQVRKVNIPSSALNWSSHHKYYLCIAFCILLYSCYIIFVVNKFEFDS